MRDYHDNEWGVPEHNDNKLFEILILEGAQAGLSWLTILKKRENYRKAFAGFDVTKIAKYNTNKINNLLKDEGIIRNKLKIASVVNNAKVFLKIQKEFGSFDAYIWGFTQGKIVRDVTSTANNPVKTRLSDTISYDLKKRGMSFVGTITVYAMLQAIGIVNGHEVDCFLSP